MTRSLNPYIPIALALVATPLVGCNVEGGNGNPDLVEPTHVDKIFSGYVLDETGAPLPGVTVVSSDGLYTTTTNAIGQFILMMEFFDGRDSLDLYFEKSGYMKNNVSIAIVDETSAYTTLLTLYNRAEPKVLDNGVGGTLGFDNNSLLLTFGPEGFADAFGNTVVGEVEIFARMMQPEDLKPEAMPVPSMLARDPGTPDGDAMIASFGMFNMEAYAGDTQVWPAAGTSFEIVMVGVDRWISPDPTVADPTDTTQYGLREGDAIPLWTMGQDDNLWDFTGDWFVVEKVSDDIQEKLARVAVSEDDDLIGSDNTDYVIRVESHTPGTAGSAPPQTEAYNCDDRPILACVRGHVDAEGLYYDEDITDPREDLETRPVSGAWVGFSGRGIAENCNECDCVAWRVVEDCEEAELSGDETYEACRNDVLEYSFSERPQNAGSGNACETRGLPGEDGGKVCSCGSYRETVTVYQGSAVTNGAGEYCANVGFPRGDGQLESAKVLKDWTITEEDPATGVRSSYLVEYEHSEKPRVGGRLQRNNVCGDGSCATWSHTMPCEWFWMNNGCAVVGGCEVHALRDFEEDSHISYYEDDEVYPY